MKWSIGVISCIALLSLSACVDNNKKSAVSSKNHLFQIATVKSLNAGVYDGDFQYKDLFAKGNMGIGTFNAIDGEMVGIDSTYYQMNSDGQLTLVNPKLFVPFAEVIDFKPVKTGHLKGIDNFAQLKRLENELTQKNTPYAVRIDGVFKTLALRNFPQQKQPYPPLADVVAKQTVFNLENIEGTLIGFWFPQYLSNIGTAGFHFHFIDKERKTGGHVIDVAFEKASYQIAPVEDLTVYFPKNEDYARADLLN